MNSLHGPLKVDDDFGLNQLEPSLPLRERVYETLEKLMVDGVLPTGLHLIEGDLAHKLGVSRNPIREALQKLAHEGYVDRLVGRGAFVHSPTMQEVDEVFQVRALLEGESARLAAQHITPAELRKLEHILRLGEAAVSGRGATQLLELNERFHALIISASNNSVIEKMMVTLRKRIRWYFSSVVVFRAADSWDQHDEIYRALRDGDGEKAASCMSGHVTQTRQTIRARQHDA